MLFFRGTKISYIDDELQDTVGKERELGLK